MFKDSTSIQSLWFRQKSRNISMGVKLFFIRTWYDKATDLRGEVKVIQLLKILQSSCCTVKRFEESGRAASPRAVAKRRAGLTGD